MLENIAMVIDNDASWWGAIAASSIAIVLGGVVLTMLKYYLAQRTEAERLQRVAEDAERKAVASALTGLGLQITAEAEERRAADVNEANIRREKDDALGRDLVKGDHRIENAFSYYCGKMDEKRPRFDE
jgi:hypothetical protein